MAITAQHKYVFNAFDYDECYDLTNDPDEMPNKAAGSSASSILDDMRTVALSI